MPSVIFYPTNRRVEVDRGSTILQAARLAEVIVEAPCNGMGTCGKCKVKLDKASQENITLSDQDLTVEENEQGVVLSCHALIMGDITVDVLGSEALNKTLKVLQDGKAYDVDLQPFVIKIFSESDQQTRVYAGETLLATEDGDTTGKTFGLVVDIGTTTLVTSLVDLQSGKELSTVSALNPQSLHAQDVLSRIHFASEAKGLATMYSAFIEELRVMIGRLTKTSGISRDNIYEIVFSGNTCMLHLATGINPRGMGRFPYTPALQGGSYVKAIDHGLEIAPQGLIYLPPIISAYVGADITSGILASQLYNSQGVALFVDIGTNGEMVLAADGKLSATSTAAGPAFEGMNISCGMRASNGAIEYFNIEVDGQITVKTIGELEPIGICGSGLLDIVGELVAHGVITKSGRFVDADTADLLPSLQQRLEKMDGKPVFRVADKVFLTQKDIRQVQLAKGAVRAGIEYLLKSVHITAEEVNGVLIAGSFGYHLRAKSLVNIGLLPQVFAEKIEFIGNTSKIGGQAFLLNQERRTEMETLVKDIEVLDLATYQDFEKVFVSFLSF